MIGQFEMIFFKGKDNCLRLKDINIQKQIMIFGDNFSTPMEGHHNCLTIFCKKAIKKFLS